MNGWKIAFWIVFILLLLETFVIVYSYNVGSQEINNKYRCSNELCYNEKADSFTYDSELRQCLCYKNGEVIRQFIFDK